MQSLEDSHGSKALAKHMRSAKNMSANKSAAAVWEAAVDIWTKNTGL